MKFLKNSKIFQTLKEKLVKAATTLILFIFSMVSSANEPLIKWYFDTKDASFGQSCAGDIDSDGKYEIVFGCYRNDGNIYALNGEDGSLIWKISTATEKSEGCNDVAPLLFDVNGDKNLEIIVPSSCNPITLCLDGKTGKIIWTANTNGSDSPPSIADIDNDGDYEVLHGEFGGSVVCIDAKNGFVKWRLVVNPNSWIQTAPTITDLDLDGNLDFIVSTWAFGENNTNKIFAFRGYDKKLLWKTNLSNVVYHGSCVTDLDNDPLPEVCIGDYSGKVYAIEGESGEIKWEYQSNFYVGAPVISADLNRDGSCEVIFSDAFGIGTLNKDGILIWHYQNTELSTNFRGPVVSDINADGNLDLIFGTNGGLFRAINGESGNLLFEMNLENVYRDTFKIDHAPLIADFDSNGKLDAFIIGGKANYPDFSKNYGRAYLIEISNSIGPEWLMFQKDIWRQSSICGLLTSFYEHNSENSSQLQTFTSEDKISLPKSLFMEGNLLSIEIYDIFCEHLLTLNPNDFYENQNRFEIQTPHLSKGVYFLCLKFTERTLITKILLY